VEPENRVVARTLESEWEACLQELEVLRQRYESAQRKHRVQLSREDRARVRQLARDLPSVWHAPTTTPADRKAMLRIAIEAVTISPVEVPKRSTRIQVQWASGAVDELCIPRIRTHRASDEAIERIRELTARGMEDARVAQRLNEEDFTTGHAQRWSASAVKRIRLEHTSTRRPPKAGAREPLPDRHPDGRYSIRGAMKRFGVNSDKVRSWIERGMVEAAREDFDWCDGAWWLSIDEATARRLEEDTTRQRRTTQRHNAGVPGRR